MRKFITDEEMEEIFKKIDAMTDEELRAEAEQIMAEVNAGPTLKDVEVPADLHDKIMEKIREYEEEKAANRLFKFIFGK